LAKNLKFSPESFLSLSDHFLDLLLTFLSRFFSTFFQAIFCRDFTFSQVLCEGSSHKGIAYPTLHNSYSKNMLAFYPSERFKISPDNFFTIFTSTLDKLKTSGDTQEQAFN